MNRVIMVEGADNIGKSTFLTNLYNRISLTIPTTLVKFSGPKTTHKHLQQYEQETVIFDFIKMLKKLDAIDSDSVVLCDRSIFGEMVYCDYRGYKVDYKSKVFKALSALTNTQFLLVIIYVNEFTFEAFCIPSKNDEKDQEYRKRTFAREVSMKFLKLAPELVENIHNLKVLRVNSNVYETIDDRNIFIHNKVTSFIADVDNKVRTSRSLNESFFSPVENLVQDGVLTCQKTNCPVYNTCELGKQHKANSVFGYYFNRPTSGVGNIKSPKYMFIGEAPGQHGCGKFGIPFYGDLSGNLFQSMLDNLNIDPLTTYVTNTILCCPKSNDLGEFSSLKNRLKLWCVKKKLVAEIENLPKSTKIIAVGAVAHETLMNLFPRLNVIKTMHPAYFIRIGKRDQYINHVKSTMGI